MKIYHCIIIMSLLLSLFGCKSVVKEYSFSPEKKDPSGYYYSHIEKLRLYSDKTVNLRGEIFYLYSGPGYKPKSYLWFWDIDNDGDVILIRKNPYLNKKQMNSSLLKVKLKDYLKKEYDTKK